MTVLTKKTVLITGCSPGGIGEALAHAFHQRGYHVFATVRDLTTIHPSGDGSTASKSTLPSLPSLTLLELDVTSSQSILACREAVAAQTEGRLDVLVNNAGTEFVAPLLEVELDRARELFEVNVWGVLAVTQSFAPLVIKAKGVVANQSSIDSVLSMAWSGIYASSKAATTRLSEILKVELAPLGVRVVTLVTGSANTPMFDKPGGQLKVSDTSYYRTAQAAANKERADHRTKAFAPSVLADLLVKRIVDGKSAGPVWYGAMADLVRYCSWLLPTAWMDGLVNAERGVKLVGA